MSSLEKAKLLMRLRKKFGDKFIFPRSRHIYEVYLLELLIQFPEYIAKYRKELKNIVWYSEENRRWANMIIWGKLKGLPDAETVVINCLKKLKLEVRTTEELMEMAAKEYKPMDMTNFEKIELYAKEMGIELSQDEVTSVYLEYQDFSEETAKSIIKRCIRAIKAKGK